MPPPVHPKDSAGADTLAGDEVAAALRHASRQRLQGRIGLKDVLHLPDGSPAPDNATLVAAARTLLANQA